MFPVAAMKRRFLRLPYLLTAVGLTLLIIGFYNQLGSNKLKQDLNDFLQPQSYGIPKVVAGEQNFTAILILTYMRSGSSLLGEIMQQHPDSFYVFEPLHMLTETFIHKFPLDYLNGTHMDYGTFRWYDVALPTLRAWLNCDLENVFQRGLFDNLFLGFGNKTSMLRECFDKRLQLDGNADFFNFTAKYCVRMLQNICLSSKYRVVKTVRTPMRQASQLLKEIPQLKILHLVRDPKDTLLSQRKKRQCGKGSLDELVNCTTRYCSRLDDDITTLENEDTFKNRVYSVRYEDFAIRPLDIFGEIYNYFGMEYTPTVRNFVDNVTSNSSQSKCLICRQYWQVGKSTADIKARVEKWRLTMKPDFQAIVDRLCKKSIPYFKYSFGNHSSIQ